jgi:hypothetical protein
LSNLDGVFIIPTGLGCSLGGDAAFNPGVKLISSCVNNLIVNPNSINASDINELPENAWYTEGSLIDRFLEGKFNLRKPKTYNKILMVVNSPIKPSSINSMNAGIWGLGADINILELNTPLIMNATINSDGTAGGTFSGVDELVEQISGFDYDALAIQTPIGCDEKVSDNYWINGGVNPWGGIEALVSKAIANKLNKPLAHAPIDTCWDNYFSRSVVKRDMAPEIISNTYSFCIFKGLHRAPSVVDKNNSNGQTLSNTDIDFMVSPYGCYGRPHEACYNSNIPVIVVRENETCFARNFIYPRTAGLIFVNNYLEAAGVIMAMNAGVDYKLIRVDTK